MYRASAPELTLAALLNLSRRSCAPVISRFACSFSSSCSLFLSLLSLSLSLTLSLSLSVFHTYAHTHTRTHARSHLSLLSLSLSLALALSLSRSLSLSLSFSLVLSRSHARTHARMYARTTHTHNTHRQIAFLPGRSAATPRGPSSALPGGLPGRPRRRGPRPGPGAALRRPGEHRPVPVAVSVLPSLRPSPFQVREVSAPLQGVIRVAPACIASSLPPGHATLYAAMEAPSAVLCPIPRPFPACHVPACHVPACHGP